MKQAGALGRVVLVGLMWLPPAGFAQSTKASAAQDWAESVDKPVNVVFYRCMQFYKSRELRAFIQREVLPLQ